MFNSGIQRIKQLARQIKYRELTEYIGQNVVINGLTTIESDLMQQLSPALPDKATMQLVEQKFLEGAVAKYGLIDIGFEVSNALLEESYRSGIKLLRDVKFFSTLPSPDDVESYNDAVAVSELILQDRIDELSLGKIFLLLFLQLPAKQRPKLRLESGFFPTTFVVQDACLTNLSSIWFNKHFYF